MSMDNRDWYRAQYGPGQSERDEPWDEGDSPSRAPISLRLHTSWKGRNARGIILLAAAALLGVAAYRSGVPTRIAAAIHTPPASSATARFVAVRFPPSGYTLLHLSPDTHRTMPVTIQTPADDPAALFVVTLRDMRMGRLIATIYMAANTVTTVVLPVDSYRVAFVTGPVWGGRGLLFGSKSKAAGLTDPITPTFAYGIPVAQSIFLPLPEKPGSTTYLLNPADFLPP